VDAASTARLAGRSATGRGAAARTIPPRSFGGGSGACACSRHEGGRPSRWPPRLEDHEAVGRHLVRGGRPSGEDVFRNDLPPSAAAVAGRRGRGLARTAVDGCRPASVAGFVRLEDQEGALECPRDLDQRAHRQGGLRDALVEVASGSGANRLICAQLRDGGEKFALVDSGMAALQRAQRKSGRSFRRQGRGLRRPRMVESGLPPLRRQPR
jgi:hypothetical protein